MLAVSVGRATRIETALTRQMIGRIQAKGYARAGLIYAIQQIRLDSLDAASSSEDSLYYCGLKKDFEGSLKDVFHQPMGEDGFFTIGREGEYGLQDEERRLNLNAINPQNVNAFVALLELFDVETDVAKQIAFSLIDWKDPDDNLSDSSYGAEKDYYTGLSRSYQPKNMFLDSVEELLLVRGMTEDIFKKIKPFVTIFPKQGLLYVNFNTASDEVLRSLARSVASTQANMALSDADSLVEQILNCRRGEDGIEGTADDKSVELTNMSLNNREHALFVTLNQYRTLKSNYFRVHSQGTAGSRKVKMVIEVIVDRNSSSIVALKMGSS